MDSGRNSSEWESNLRQVGACVGMPHEPLLVIPPPGWKAGGWVFELDQPRNRIPSAHDNFASFPNQPDVSISFWTADQLTDDVLCRCLIDAVLAIMPFSTMCVPNSLFFTLCFYSTCVYFLVDLSSVAAIANPLFYNAWNTLPHVKDFEANIHMDLLHVSFQRLAGHPKEHCVSLRYVSSNFVRFWVVYNLTGLPLFCVTTRVLMMWISYQDFSSWHLARQEPCKVGRTKTPPLLGPICKSYCSIVPTIANAAITKSEARPNLRNFEPKLYENLLHACWKFIKKVVRELHGVLTVSFFQ